MLKLLCLPRVSALALCSCVLLMLVSNVSHAQSNRAIGVIRAPDGSNLGRYAESHALLIGMSRYYAGWPTLDSIPSELKQIKQALKARGFTVHQKMDLDSEELEDAFSDFIDHYGYVKDNRLLFFFAGHGHTLQNGAKGYLVPVDAPDPRKDPIGFKRKALDMNQITSWARQMDAKHALFLFDSCFSGSIFKQRALPDIPPNISRMTALPVRQFITAGSANEEVPAQSTFAKVFVDTLNYGIADYNRDGFTSGTELGLFLSDKIPRHARQSPQFGKLPDYELSRGDFVFFTGQAASNPAPVRPSTPRTTQPTTPRVTQPTAFPLVVNTSPNDARIRVLNIGPKYQRGMTLPAGSYHLEVSKPGYETERRWEQLRPGQTSFNFTLQQQARAPAGFVKIPAGEFQMGCVSGLDCQGDEKPVHWVSVPSFYLGEAEVTFAEWDACVNAGGCSHRPDDEGWGRGNRPVINVSWKDIQTYIQWRSQQDGVTYRLPSEAEWEYAARAGSDTQYSWGNSIDCGKARYGWYSDECGKQRSTDPVRSFAPNKWGVYDMHGNVWEWVEDCWNDSYGGAPTDGRPWLSGDCGRRVLRGGSWFDVPTHLRSATRGSGNRTGLNLLGFRLARDI